jgi:hypothetical protein
MESESLAAHHEGSWFKRPFHAGMLSKSALAMRWAALGVIPCEST